MAPIKHSTVNFIIPIFLTVMFNHKTDVKKTMERQVKIELGLGLEMGDKCSFKKNQQ